MSNRSFPSSYKVSANHPGNPFNELREEPGTVVYTDPVLTRSVVVSTVAIVLLFLAVVILGSIALGHFYNRAACSPTSTATKTTVPLELQVTNATATLCPLNEGACEEATAEVVESGNITLQSDTDLVVGWYSSSCVTIGPSESVDDATDRACTLYLNLNGLGDLGAGLLSIEGIKTVVTEDGETTFPAAFAVTGGVNAYAKPIGGELTMAYNATSLELTMTGSVILVN
jgi:hypothetical protein